MSGSAGLRLSPDPLSGEQRGPHGGAVGPVAPLPEPGVRTQGALRGEASGSAGTAARNSVPLFFRLSEGMTVWDSIFKFLSLGISQNS